MISAFRLFKFMISCLILILAGYHCFAQSEQRIKISSVIPSVNTGQDYTPWLTDDLNSMVEDEWDRSNWQYIDVTLKLQQHSKITKVVLYDWQGVFTDKPAYIYALNGQQRTLLGTFTGESYNAFDTIKLAAAVEADAIIVNKYNNNIPQKVFIFGIPGLSTVTDVITSPIVVPPVNVVTYTKIPVDGKRWYQLNSASDGIASMFDGNTATTVQPEYGKIFKNYDAYYPVLPGEQIDVYQVKFFSNNADLGDYPLTLSAITTEGKRVVIGTFKGGQYGTWTGPYPDRQLSGASKFTLDQPLKNIKYLVLNCWYDFPPEIELYGNYVAGTPVTAATKKGYKLKNYFGINAFEWDFENPNAPDVIDEARMKPAKAFTQVRHYLDWFHLEQTEGQYTFNPSPSGGWNYDAMYQRLKAEGMEVVADIKTLPQWMQDTYPDSLKGDENIPVKYGKDYADPKSYIEQARLAYQFAARYGYNAGVDSTTVSTAPIAQYPGGPVNVTKRSLGLVRYIECDNERDKWWKGRKAYQTAWEYAANLSAFYDGHKNTMGPGVGVKNADPNMKVVMGGLAYANTDYIKGMVDWCRKNRGYNSDGSVNLCWDVINYHFYSNNGGLSQGGTPTRGTAPEMTISGTANVAQEFINVAHQYAGDMPVWVTELGNDVNQGSPLKAIAIGKKTVLQTQADWQLRAALLYARQGVERIFFYEMYDDNPTNPIQFGSSGLINTNKTRKPAADYFYQANKLIGEYTYKETLGTDPLVDRYELNGKSAYVLTVPDEKDRTAAYTLNLPGADSARICTPKAGSNTMDIQLVKLSNGKLNVTVTETPQFIIPFGIPAPSSTSNLVTTADTAVTSTVKRLRTIMSPEGNGIIATEANNPKLTVYPNPAVNYINISVDTFTQNKINIRLSDAISGKVYRNISDHTEAGPFTKQLDVSNIPNGSYLVEVQQGNSMTVKKFIKSN
ncbi:hypothetical protein GCM10027037_03540 [Mucilaginibacter koreensis]